MGGCVCVSLSVWEVVGWSVDLLLYYWCCSSTHLTLWTDRQQKTEIWHILAAIHSLTHSMFWQRKWTSSQSSSQPASQPAALAFCCHCKDSKFPTLTLLSLWQDDNSPGWETVIDIQITVDNWISVMEISIDFSWNYFTNYCIRQI